MTASTQPADESKSAPAVDTFAAIRKALADFDANPASDAHGLAFMMMCRPTTIASLLAAADRARELEALLKEALEISDNWPGIAYTADLIGRCKRAMPGWTLTYE